MFELNFNRNDVIEVEGIVYRVEGKIMYKDVQDGSQWTEYLLAAESTYMQKWHILDKLDQ